MKHERTFLSIINPLISLTGMAKSPLVFIHCYILCCSLSLRNMLAIFKIYLTSFCQSCTDLHHLYSKFVLVSPVLP